MKKEQSIQRDLQKIKQSKQFLTIMILLFVSLLFWIIISLISSQTNKKADPKILELAKPLTPVIDSKVFDLIEQKKLYSEKELSAFTIFKVLLSRDGKTQKVVPIEVTIDDLEPKSTPRPKKKSLLQTQDTKPGSSSLSEFGNLIQEQTLATPSAN